MRKFEKIRVRLNTIFQHVDERSHNGITEREQHQLITALHFL